MLRGDPQSTHALRGRDVDYILPIISKHFLQVIVVFPLLCTLDILSENVMKDKALFIETVVMI